MDKQIETRNGLALRGREWPRDPARGTIVLVHGPGERTARVFATLFHEILNEPEQAEVLAAVSDGLDTLFVSPTRSPR